MKCVLQDIRKTTGKYISILYDKQFEWNLFKNINAAWDFIKNTPGKRTPDIAARSRSFTPSGSFSSDSAIESVLLFFWYFVSSCNSKYLSNFKSSAQC
jgi:hypothetical protein